MRKRGTIYNGDGAMKILVQRFAADETGAAAVEYGLIAVGISVAIIAVLQGIGIKLSTTLNSVTTSVQ
jgi:pilus assembly protein Flp/PilA